MKPFVLLKCAITPNGFLDDDSEQRLVISSQEDLDQVLAMRGDYDAIMIGANTLRKDNPSLLAKDIHPAKVSLTSTGELDYQSRFFTTGDCNKYIYCSEGSGKEVENTYFIESSEEKWNLSKLLEDLYTRGVKKLMLEGGANLIKQFLEEDLVDRVRLAIGQKQIESKKGVKLELPKLNFTIQSTELFGDTKVIWMDRA